METLLCKCGNTVTHCNWIVENFTRWAWNCGNIVARYAWNFENAGIIYTLNCGNTAANGWKRGNTATNCDWNCGRKATICARKCGNTAIIHVKYSRLLQKNNKSYGKHGHKFITERVEPWIRQNYRTWISWIDVDAHSTEHRLFSGPPYTQVLTAIPVLTST